MYVPQRRGWRYLATRLNGDGTETLLDVDLPIDGVSITDTLSGDQELTAHIDPVYTRLLGDDGTPTLLEWGTGIYAVYDNDIRFGGILESSGFSGPEWALTVPGFTGYPRSMPYTGSGYKGVKVDAIDPVRVIWDHLQGQPGGNLGLVVDDTTTDGAVVIGSTLAADQYDPEGGGIDGVSLESQAYQLNRFSNHDLGGDIDSLAGATPFDYHERHYWKADGTIGHALDIGYPALGRKRSDLRYTYGVNIFDVPEVSRDGAGYASGTLVLGNGNGSAAKWALRELAERPQGRLRRVAVVVDDTIKTNAACGTRADSENKWRHNLEDITTLTVTEHPNAPLGSAAVGDTVIIDGRSDWQTFSIEVRILQITYSPSDSSKAEYTVARTDKLTS